MAVVAAAGSAGAVPEPGGGRLEGSVEAVAGSLLSTCSGTVARTVPDAPSMVNVPPAGPMAVAGAPASTESATPSTGVTVPVPAWVVSLTASAPGPVSTSSTVAGDPSASPTMLIPTP